MNFQTHLEELKKLNLPEGQFAVISSGALAVRGIREAKDLDVMVTIPLWNELIKKYPVINQDGVSRIQFNNEIEILDPTRSAYGDQMIVPIEEMFAKADVFDSIKFMNLEHLRKIKQKMAREKDLRDIALIDVYLKTGKK
jgi:hypothetical protein